MLPITPDVFDLTGFFSAFGYRSGNCVDVAYFNQLGLMSQGVTSTTKRYTTPYTYGFVTNAVCPIGSDSTILANYNRIRWDMHQNVLDGSAVYDACLALPVDLSGAGYQNPPSNWPLNGYWQTTSGFSSPMFWGLVSRPGASSDIPTIDPSIIDGVTTRIDTPVDLDGIV
jgi:hypothetical protein